MTRCPLELDTHTHTHRIDSHLTLHADLQFTSIVKSLLNPVIPRSLSHKTEQLSLAPRGEPGKVF